MAEKIIIGERSFTHDIGVKGADGIPQISRWEFNSPEQMAKHEAHFRAANHGRPQLKNGDLTAYRDACNEFKKQFES